MAAVAASVAEGEGTLVLGGLGYSNNANSGPAGLIQSFGVNAVPTPDASRQPDFNAVAAATLRHPDDLGRQDMGPLESGLEFPTTHQFQVSQANVLLLDFTTGPRTSPFESGLLDDMTLRPLLTVTGLPRGRDYLNNPPCRPTPTAMASRAR